MSNSPITGDGALHALAVALVPHLSTLLPGSSSRPYSQRERPAGAGLTKFLRTWRRAHAAGDAETWAEGRARLMTPACWSRWSRTEVQESEAAPPADAMLEALGGKRVAK